MNEVREVKVLKYTGPSVPIPPESEKGEVRIVEKTPLKSITGVLGVDGSWKVTLDQASPSNPINRRDYNRFLRGLKAAIGVYLREQTRLVYRKEAEPKKLEMVEASKVADQNLRASLAK